MTTTPDPWHSPNRPRVINLIDELPDGFSDYAAKAQVIGYIERLAAHGIFAPRASALPSVTLTVGVLKALMRAAYLDGRADEEADAKLRPPPEPICEAVEFAGTAEDRYGDVAFWAEQDGEVECFEIGWGHGGGPPAEGVRSQYGSLSEFSAMGWGLYESNDLHDGFGSLGDVIAHLGPNVYLSLEDYRAGRSVPIEAVINTARAWANLPTLAETPDSEIDGCLDVEDSEEDEEDSE
jgi:hypothetical protein